MQSAIQSGEIPNMKVEVEPTSEKIGRENRGFVDYGKRNLPSREVVAILLRANQISMRNKSIPDHMKMPYD